MNPQIKELAEQALDQAVPQTWTTLTAYDLNKFTEKFAKLIVAECMSNLHLHGYDDAMNQIKQHFEVE